MIDPKNVVVLSGGLIEAPEVNNGVARLRLACDYSGTDQANPDNRSGYFNVKYFLNNAQNKSNAEFVTKQIENENFKKGSGLSVQGRIVHERWEDKDGDKRSTYVIYAEAITYSGSARPAEDGDAATTAASPVPESF